MFKKYFIFVTFLSLQLSSKAMIHQMMRLDLENSSNSGSSNKSIKDIRKWSVSSNLGSIQEESVKEAHNSSLVKDFNKFILPGNGIEEGVCRWAFEGDLEAVKEAIENGYNINLANSAGETALMYAAMGGHLNMLNFLLDNGAKADLKDKQGFSALSIAAQYGQSAIVEELFELDPESYFIGLKEARNQLKCLKSRGLEFKNFNKVARNQFKEDIVDAIEILKEKSKPVLAMEVQNRFNDDNISELIMSYVD